jgi:hypothetical protein
MAAWKDRWSGTPPARSHPPARVRTRAPAGTAGVARTRTPWVSGHERASHHPGPHHELLHGTVAGPAHRGPGRERPKAPLLSAWLPFGVHARRAPVRRVGPRATTRRWCRAVRDAASGNQTGVQIVDRRTGRFCGRSPAGVHSRLGIPFALGCVHELPLPPGRHGGRLPGHGGGACTSLLLSRGRRRRSASHPCGPPSRSS